MKKTLTVVVVEWGDAHVSLDYQPGRGTVPVTSVGMLLEEDNDYIVIGQTAFSSTDWTHGSVSCTTTIPRGWIKELVRVREVSVVVEVDEGGDCEGCEGECQCGVTS